MSKAERQYLERHAEPESLLADRLGSYGHAVVLPAYGEGEELIEALRSIPPGPLGDVLVVLIVNGRASSAPWVHDHNRELLGRLRDAFGSEDERPWEDPPARLLRFPVGHILWVDRASPERFLPDDQGVGLARKIGADLALRLHAAGRLVSSFIHSTDADVELPADYFARLSHESSGRPAALLYPFVHRPEDDADLARAIALYEISLRYYVLGLAYAGSPYAYHTIGSTLAIDATSYAMVRGFPKRTAGEDFYLLSKLAKIGPIVPAAGDPIVLRGRPSDRVPFGTGPAVRRIAEGGPNEFTLYDPVLFDYLRVWLESLAAMVPGDSNRAQAFAELECERRGLDAERLLSAAGRLTLLEAARHAASEAKDLGALKRRVAISFDAFRTLKLLHALQEAGLPKVPWAEALCRAPFVKAALSTVGPVTADAESLRRLAAQLALQEGS
jgi:hypothetical protein